MSDLGGGRAANGGARTGGPVPISSSNIRPPTEIMRARQAREARRQEEQKAEEQRRLAEDNRRRSAERRAAAGSGAPPRFSGASSQYTPDVSAQQAPFESRPSGSGRVAGSSVLGDPTGRGDSGYSSARPTRGPSVPQKDQPRPAAATTDATRRARASQSAARQPVPPASAAPSQPQQSQRPSESGAERRTGPASFPHAFERWETLSSHWEGLTSYWLHKLESNTQAIGEAIPNAQTLNRQITDLSAAGANLFSAVVELQRLRASSERKFHRWYIDIQGEIGENKEARGLLQKQLEEDRTESTRQITDHAITAENAKREMAETRRELMISKDEARRAWEELGRRNEEENRIATSLKEGEVTVVHGIEVTPYLGGMSRGASLNQRPGTRDATQQYGSGMGSAAGAVGYQSPGDTRDYYQEETSPTNTDPFLESGQQAAPSVQPRGSSLQANDTYQPPYYPVGSIPQRVSPAQTTSSPRPARTPQRGDIPEELPESERFYQHGPQETFLHYPHTTTDQATAGGSSAVGRPSSRPREDVHSEESYVESLSEGGTEYVIDAAGNVRHDDESRPIIFTRRTASGNNGNGNGNGESDYDTAADIRREQELATQYGSGMLPGSAQLLPSTSEEAMQNYAPTTAGQQQEEAPDYEGTGYGDEYDSGPTRHHHPTRLSDVLEEEEERSSRRTGD